MDKKIFLLLAGIFCLQMASGDNKHTWHPLFGKNLAQAEYSPEVWKQNGNILSAGPEECIWTMEEYDNFELDMEFNNTEGAHSGILLYCSDRDNWENRSIRIHLGDPAAEQQEGEEETGLICGAVDGYGVAAQDGIVKNAGQWNHIRIRSVGGRLSIIMNGRKVTEWDMNITLPDRPVRGYIGLQGHIGESPLRFRNIKIRQINESESKSTTNKIEREPRNFPTY